jgi:hypothetical protein
VYSTVIAGIIVVAVFSLIVPFNMDEFIHYHPLLCHYYPLNALNTFREHCRGYDLNLANTGVVVPLRSYAYSGSFPALYYFPLFVLWRSPLSARFLGLVFIAAQAGILARLFRHKFFFVLLGLLSFFPYVFQHLVDTGPVGFHITSIYLLAWFFERWVSSQRWRYPLLSAIVIFLGIWTKFAYFWLLPGIGILFLLALVQYYEKVRAANAWRLLMLQYVISALLLLGLVTIILLSTTPENPLDRPYLQQLLNSESYSFSEMMRGAWLRSPVLSVLGNPLQATQRVFVVASANYFTLIYSMLLYGSIPLTLLILSLKKSAPPMQIFKPAMLFLSFVLTVITIAHTRDAGAMHHAVLAFPFLVLSAFATIDALRTSTFDHILLRKLGIRAGLLFVVLNAVFFVMFPFQTRGFADDPSKLALHATLNDRALAKNYIYVVTDWGMYYYQGLFGDKNQSVLYFEPLREPFHVAELQALAHKQGRKLLFMYKGQETVSDIGLIRSLVYTEPCYALRPKAQWQAILEPGVESACSQTVKHAVDHQKLLANILW